MVTGNLLELTSYTEVTVDPLPEDFFGMLDATKNAKDLLKEMLNHEYRITSEDMMNYKFFRLGYCPKSLPESTFDEVPSFVNDDRRL
ncbi:hypothetical protein BGZ97_002454 [Linnemannia gamsii]|uniref:Uncharacterized protein n=1 Tax=Linnemannia gamsii TaxID=64522 RepID=A0A9P6UTS7_9FUNG|nr:hypothetical protein BGZ97_002454 [Linnemannia gamsii]